MIIIILKVALLFNEYQDATAFINQLGDGGFVKKDVCNYFHYDKLEVMLDFEEFPQEKNTNFA